VYFKIQTAVHGERGIGESNRRQYEVAKIRICDTAPRLKRGASHVARDVAESPVHRNRLDCIGPGALVLNIPLSRLMINGGVRRVPAQNVCGNDRWERDMRLLIVEDEARIAEILRMSLARADDPARLTCHLLFARLPSRV
jgi:hypothetical protein